MSCERKNLAMCQSGGGGAGCDIWAAVRVERTTSTVAVDYNRLSV